MNIFIWVMFLLGVFAIVTVIMDWIKDFKSWKRRRDSKKLDEKATEFFSDYL